jgi:hypothetical protein
MARRQYLVGVRKSKEMNSQENDRDNGETPKDKTSHRLFTRSVPGIRANPTAGSSIPMGDPATGVVKDTVVP